MIKGLRIILTTTCNRRCTFCYQQNYNTTISIKTLRDTLDTIEIKPQYITVLGGEVLYLKDWKKYLVLIAKKFPNISKNLITNGDFAFSEVQKLGYTVTVSNKVMQGADRYNIYYNGKSEINLRYIDDLSKVTICSELRNEPISPPQIRNEYPQKIESGHYKYSFGSHYFNHENDYDNDNLIVLPNGKLTTNFRDIINFK